MLRKFCIVGDRAKNMGLVLTFKEAVKEQYLDGFLERFIAAFAGCPKNVGRHIVRSADIVTSKSVIMQN